MRWWMASCFIASWQIDGETTQTVTDFIFLNSKCSREIKRCLFLGRKAITNLDSVLKNRDITLLTKVPESKLWFFLQIWELDHKEGWAPKNWCFYTVLLEKTLESSLDFKEIKPVNPKGNHSWIFIGGTDAEIKAPILWAPDVKTWLIGKDPDTRQDWRQEEKGRQWRRWLSGITSSVDMHLSKLRREKDRETCCAAVCGVTKS